MDTITVVVYKNSRGKRIYRRNGKRITKIVADKLLAGKTSSKVEVTDNYDTITYKI